MLSKKVPGGDVWCALPPVAQIIYTWPKASKPTQHIALTCPTMDNPDGNLRHSRTIVAGARAVQMSPGATPEAQGARNSAWTEARARGLFASRKPRGG